MNRILLAAGAALLLSGCMSLSRSSTVTALPTADASQLKVSEIKLTVADGVKVSPKFEDIFRQHVQAKLDACAKGERPVRLEAKVDRLDKSNAVMTAIVAGANVLRGSARLVDVGSGAVVADYQVGQTVVGRSVAVVVMAKAEEQLSDGFGDELCKQAFPKPVVK
ncbi:MAG TPA: lipoprotein [Phenylobacterium sp.]|nr:lipoprotein [Phenylobacterium sp.]